MSVQALSILAGPEALAELRDGGFSASAVRAVIGASGGPKWLVLHGLDRVLFPWLLAGATSTIHTVGSSIGAWRLACLATRDPVAALDRLADAYIEQHYGPSPSPREISAEAARILEVLLGSDGTSPLVTHERLRMHIVTTRFLHLGAREGRSQLLALGLAALGNAAHRRTLAVFLERVVFDARGDAGPFAPWRDLPTKHVTLDEHNLRAALSASGAIPGVMAGVIDPPGAPRGTYRDGGVSDYHFGAEIDPKHGIALYPHFYTQLVPGWFDKALSYRMTRGLRRVVLIAPSPEHVAQLPYGRIPDRKDFARMNDRDRIAAWRKVIELGTRMGESFAELAAGGGMAKVVRPL